MNKQSDLISRLQDEADLCRNEGADDIAMLLDESAKALAAQAGPALVPLTDEQIDAVLDAAKVGELPEGWSQIEREIARAIERAHGIGAQAPASTRPADASISGQRIDMVPRVPTTVLTHIHAYGDARADNESSHEHLKAAIVAIREWAAALAAAPQAPSEQPAEEDGADMPLDHAMHLAECWAAGKLIGGDGCGAAVALLAEVKRLKAVAPAEPVAQAVDAETRRLAQVALDESSGAALVCDWMEAALKVCKAVVATPAAREAGTTAGN